MNDDSKPSIVSLFVTASLIGAIGAFIWWRLRWYAPVEQIEKEHEKPQKAETPSDHVKSQGHLKPLQLAEEGTGPLFYRRYRAIISDPILTAAELFKLLSRDINRFAPSEIARFEKKLGDSNSMKKGDEFEIHIAGPWNGPIHVIDIDGTSMTFATQEGHLEAGEITFRIRPLSPRQADQSGGYIFEIVSWSRSSDLLVDILYDKLGIIKKAQESMWVFFCQSVVEESGGELVDEIQVSTERIPVKKQRSEKTT